jgi:hypothetical protein
MQQQPPQQRTGHTAYKTKQSVRAVTAALKAQWAAERKQREQEALMRELTTPAIRKPATASKATASVWQRTLAGLPGGARDEAKTGAHRAFLRQVDHPETGCVVVLPETAKGAATLRRLQNSAKNANTTTTRR